MIQKFSLVIFMMFAFNANITAENNRNPLTDFIGLEIEKTELEQELFGNMSNMEALCIASIELYEMEEEVTLGFNTKNYLPAGFEARKGLSTIDWTSFELMELEEDFDIGFDTKDYLPEGFDPYKGVDCADGTEIIVQ